MKARVKHPRMRRNRRRINRRHIIAAHPVLILISDQRPVGNKILRVDE